jgi:hypothetical protein
MENGNKTVEYLGMAAVKDGTYTDAAVDSDWHVSQINCHCWWQVMNHYPRILNCRYSTVASEIGNSGEPYLLTSVVILSSPWSVNTDHGKLL